MPDSDTWRFVLPRDIGALDLALGILFGIGVALFSMAVYLEATEHASFYTLLFGAGTMISFAATFVAAIRK